MKLAIEIFRPGTHVAMSGAQIAFSEADLRDAAAAYDPAHHEAPAVLGHPKTDDPAHGWVEGLEFRDGGLFANFKDLEPAFAEALQQRRYAKVSPSFWTASAKGNPTPGKLALRHVGFLGAAVPGCKGLKPIAFAADDESETFATTPMWSFAWGFSAVADVFRRMREQLIEKTSVEDADKVYPEWMIRELGDAAKAARDAADAGQPAFAEAPGQSGDDPHAARTAELDARAAALDAREAGIATREQAAEAERREAENSAFVDGLVRDGKVAPGRRAEVIAMLASLDDVAIVAFAEGEATQRANFKRMLLAATPVISFAEIGAGDGDPSTTVDPAALAAEASAYIAEQAGKGVTVSADAAVRHVQKGKAQ